MKGIEVTKNNLKKIKESQENKEQYKLLEISTPIAIFTTAYAPSEYAHGWIKNKVSRSYLLFTGLL